MRPRCRVAARVEAWRELRSRYDAAKDIPVRRGELAAKRAAIAEILRRLGRVSEGRAAESAPALCARSAALEDLIAERSGVQTKLDGARAALDEARNALAHALEEAPRAEGDGAAVETLKTRLQAARRDEFGLAASRRARRVQKAGPEAGGRAGGARAVDRRARGAWRACPSPARRRPRRCASACRKPAERRQHHVDRLAEKTARSRAAEGGGRRRAARSNSSATTSRRILRAARDAAWSEPSRASSAAASADAVRGRDAPRRCGGRCSARQCA